MNNDNTHAPQADIDPIVAKREALATKVESALRERLAHLDIKPGSKRALAIEQSFIPGAMAAIQAMFPHEEAPRDVISPMIPPRWIFSVMRGQTVLEN